MWMIFVPTQYTNYPRDIHKRFSVTSPTEEAVSVGLSTLESSYPHKRASYPQCHELVICERAMGKIFLSVFLGYMVCTNRGDLSPVGERKSVLISRIQNPTTSRAFCASLFGINIKSVDKISKERQIFIIHLNFRFHLFVHRILYWLFIFIKEDACLF